MTALEEYESETRDPLYPEVEDPAPYVRQDVADAAIESLKCCGNCGHEDEEVLSDTPCGLCRPVREKHSSPSHWMARKGSL